MEGSGGGGLDSLLAQLRRTSNQEPQANSHNQHQNQTQNQTHPPNQTQELLNEFSSYHQANPSRYNYGSQSQDSPQFPDSPYIHAPGVMESQMPSAPTPPSAGFPNAQFPPSMMGAMGFGRAASYRHPAAPSYTHERNNDAGLHRSNSDRPENLLKLLNFSGAGQTAQENRSFAPQPASPPYEEPNRDLILAPAPAPADPRGLLAALMRDTGKDEHHQEQTAPAPAPAPHPPTQAWASTATSAESQQYLLNLLNRPKPGQNERAYATDAAQPTTLTPQSLVDAPTGSHGNTAVEHSQPQVPTSSFEFESPNPKVEGASRSGMFSSYTNPFEDLAASSPLNRTPKNSTPGGASGSIPAPGQTADLPIQILKKPSSATSETATSEPARSEHGRKRLKTDLAQPQADQIQRNGNDSSAGPRSDGPTPIVVNVTPPPEKQETVAEAVSHIAPTADQEAQNALARAEHEKSQAEIAHDLDQMMHAKTEREFEESAQAAAQAIKKELEREGSSVLEDNLPADVAQAVKDIVDEAAASTPSHAPEAPVADSWESAEADEIVVVEEEPEDPVKVYNFPMKPWIAISVQDPEGDSRPVFRDEAIIDIARLKKEFDQVDRNLVTASEFYMTYGMSKAGGLRVIRQMDGKDAKLFTDTKDRIFNLALSSTPTDQSEIHKECIIGTGISGTVYWVQVRDGEKDHLEDTNPEQYGFALPPMSSQEGGDTPGGVLKTRARTSTSHPEYFAVGRGKSINIIWPGFIMQHGLFKPGHDRVVDTDRLAKQCSLKINTGKAGKDFTFSQDDTMVVSLDKSGRVKFWDVRDLTAAKEGSDSRLPAHTSMEVKEPLLTLTTTPEGEKAWPTSVLLLDKLRPYQKRGALRYMIVGMKQNHTLQLWDLALGKPVQEFNLPHSKESDAVCSVMYHPPTGMIVVGHPTRNSIYFAHLSAPKYGMKNMSQVDYILRLNAQDSSIPQPESTAVISGLREYSFGNKGILRSLDILATPTSSTEGDDQALFELYGVHSKGVTCIVVKQAELGWTRDNKVMAPVDAVEAGIVKIEALRVPAPPPASETAAPAEEPVVRAIVPRPAKELVQSTPTSQDDTTPRKAGPTPGQAKKDTAKDIGKDTSKDEEGAPQASAPAEKSEKKGRKKKAAAAAAAAVAADQVQSNGASNSPKVGPVKNEHGNAKSNAPPVSGPSLSQVQELVTSVKEQLAREIQSSNGEVVKKIESNLSKRDQEFETKFKSLLDMISNVLNDNTQEVLNHIILKQFKTTLLPALRDDVAKSISEQVSTKVHNQVARTVQTEVQRSLPGAVASSLKQQDLIKAISDSVAHSVGRNVEDAFMHNVTTRIVPSFTTVAAQTAQRIGNDVLNQVNEELARVESVQRADAAKIDNLVSLTNRLSETVATMAAAQSQFQAEFLKLQAQRSHETHSHVAHQPQQPAQQHQIQGYHAQHQAPTQHSGLQHHQQQVPQYGGYQQQQQQQQHTPSRHPPSQSGHSQVGSVLSAHGPGSYHSPGGHSNHMVSPPHAHVHQPHQPPPQAPSGNSSAVGSQLVYAGGSDTREQGELERLVAQIDTLMASGNQDEAMMRWLQGSPHEQEVFSRVLKKYNPDFMRRLQPLVLLSVGATVSNDIEGPVLSQKLAWIEMFLLNLNQLLGNMEPEILSITPKILDLVKSRVETIFMRISNTSAHDPSLKNLAQMVQLISKMMSNIKPRAPPY